MTQNKIQDAFSHIEPEEGARQRMYANILQKAAQQAEPQPEAAAPSTPASKSKAKVIPFPLRRFAGLAAVFALVAVLGVRQLQQTLPTAQTGSQEAVMVTSPIQEVSGPADFAPLNLWIDAPANATDKVYLIMEGQIAQVQFTLEGHDYILSAGRLDEDFSGLYGTVQSTQELGAPSGALLETLDSGDWRVHWQVEDVSYYLINVDDASLEDILFVLEAVTLQ